MVQEFLNLTEENSLQLWTVLLDIFHTRRKITTATKLAWVYKDDDLVTVKAVYRQDVNQVQPDVFLGNNQFEVSPITVIQQIAHHTPGASDRYRLMDAGVLNALYWTNGNARKMYAHGMVWRWVGNVKLMELDNIFLPTNDSTFHWMLFAIIHYSTRDSTITTISHSIFYNGSCPSTRGSIIIQLTIKPGQ
jgi:hypothetical protein